MGDVVLAAESVVVKVVMEGVLPALGVLVKMLIVVVLVVLDLMTWARVCDFLPILLCWWHWSCEVELLSCSVVLLVFCLSSHIVHDVTSVSQFPV